MASSSSLKEFILSALTGPDGDPVAKVSLWVAVLTLLASISGIYYARRSVREAERLERQQSARFGFTYVDREDCLFSLTYYVEPDCSSIDPSAEDDLRAVIPSREPAYRALSSLLQPASKYRHVLILADTGMGKTSLLYNLLRQNQRLRRSKQRRFLYVPLGRPDVLNKISAVANKTETILLLDAFDEDTRAVHDRAGRMIEILTAAADFNAVLITCRTQFFGKDEEIPRETGLVKISPRRIGESGVHLLYKLYLDPFSQRQIDKWVKKRFPFYHPVARLKARRLIRKIAELAVRPMLLTAVPDLISDRETVGNIYDVYRYMIRKWFEREGRWIEPDILSAFSMSLAVDIFIHREVRGIERVSLAELQHYLPDEGWKFTSRSLLNRDPEGNFKFAHRSIMEFMFVDAAFSGDRRCLDVPWTDFMVELFWKALVSERVELSYMALPPEKMLECDLRTCGILSAGHKQGLLAKFARSRGIPGAEGNRYSRLFIKTGSTKDKKTGDVLFVCDLMRNVVFAFNVVSSHSRVDSYEYVDADLHSIMAGQWKHSVMYGVAEWRTPTEKEIVELFGIKEVKALFDPHGVSVWCVGAISGSLAVAHMDAQQEAPVVEPEYEWRERLAVDPMLTKARAKATLVQVTETDAEEFFFRHVRPPRLGPAARALHEPGS
jgi:hypothetical protein